VTALREGFARVAAERRVALVEDARGLVQTGDPAAIVSPLPYLVVERGRKGFGRLRKLALEQGFVLRARVRPEPPEPAGGFEVRVAWRDARGRAVPVACADRRGHSLRLLVELESMEVLEHEGSVLDPAGLIVRRILEEPLAALLAGDGEPSVGTEVESQLRGLLQEQESARAQALERELSLLERIASAGSLPGFMGGRLEWLRGVQREPRPAPPRTEAPVPREVSRLRRLVATRVCGALRFGRGEISGLINPRRLARGRSVRALAFRLELDRARCLAVLRLWSPAEPEGGRGRPQCLGEGDLILRQLADEGDLFGVVDVVLNYVETNAVGAGLALHLAREEPEPDLDTPTFLRAARAAGAIG
jgi:hypothetical protein